MEDNPWTRIPLRLLKVMFPDKPTVVELPGVFSAKMVLALILWTRRSSKWKYVPPMFQISKGCCTYFSRSIQIAQKQPF